MGVNRGYFGKVMKDLGLALGKGAAGRASKKWPGTPQALAFREFWYGPVESAEPSIDICEEETNPVQDNMENMNEPTTRTESLREACAPTNGQLISDRKAEDALDMVKAILAGKIVHMAIIWDTFNLKEG